MDVEKLRQELKAKIDEAIDTYLMDDNALVRIPNENIYMEFILNNQNYVVFTDDEEDVEEMEMMFAKADFVDGNRVLRNIESSEELEQVVQEFYRRLEWVAD